MRALPIPAAPAAPASPSRREGGGGASAELRSPPRKPPLSDKSTRTARRVPPPDFLKDIILRLPLRENWQGRDIAIFYGETGFGYLEWRRCAGTIGPGADVGILGTLRREALGQPIANPITGEGAQG